MKLTEEGRRQAAAAAEALREIAFDRVITSGLPRTVETAKIVAPGSEPERLPELREIEGGRLADIADADLEQTFRNAFRGRQSEERTFLGGETIGSLLDRVLPALDRIVADESWDTALLVLHGGVNRAILSRAISGARAFLGSLEQAPACVNVLDYDGEWLVRSVNIAAYDLAHRHPPGRETTMEQYTTTSTCRSVLEKVGPIVKNGRVADHPARREDGGVPMASTTATEIVGPFRSPRNISRDAGAGSIHDDATASKLGFKGGTVGGSIHMDQFAPLLISLFGEEWLERGNLSLFFLQPTVDEELVRCFARHEPGARQAQVSMENEQGDQIAVGTASCGEADTDTEVRRRMAKLRPSTELRILAGRKVGDQVTDPDWRVTAPGDRILDVITEPLAAYRGEGRWDGEVVPMSHTVHSIIGVQKQLTENSLQATGLYGALELQYHHGPLVADRDYVAHAKIVALTESPKTENMWWECTYSDAAGHDVVTVLQYLRFMKASSPLWTEA